MSVVNVQPVNRVMLNEAFHWLISISEDDILICGQIRFLGFIEKPLHRICGARHESAATTFSLRLNLAIQGKRNCLIRWFASSPHAARSIMYQ